MNCRIFLISIVLIILTFSLPLYAGNSIFSYHGTPCQNFGNDIYGMTMGDVGVSDIFRKNTGYGNPAILGISDKTFFSTGLMFGWTNYTSKSAAGIERKFKDNSLDFPVFSIAVPYKTHHFGFQFNSLSSGVAKNQITTVIDSLSITETQSIDNYIYRADLLYAYNLKNFNLGIGLNYYFGHDIHRLYQDGGFGIFNTSEKLERTYKNPTATIGFTADFKTLALGGYFTKGATLEGESIRSTIHATENLGKYEHIIPNHIAMGFTQKILRDCKITTDFHIDLWEMEDKAEYNQNSWKVGIGFAEEPALNSKKTFLGRMPKRIGYSYRILPFKVIDTIKERSLTAGITVPIKKSDNRLDLGLQYLWRGDLNQNMLQDRSLMFMVGISGFDIISKENKRTAPREIPSVEELTE